MKDTYLSLYLSSLQEWRDDSVDSVALMCQGEPRTDSSHMYSLIVMYPQIPYSRPMVQMRDTRQAIWEMLWHKSSSNNWLAVWMPLHISVTVFSICRFLCLHLALIYFSCLFVCTVCKGCDSDAIYPTVQHQYQSALWNQEDCNTRGKQRADMWTMTSSSSGHITDSNPLSELLQKITYYSTRGNMTSNLQQSTTLALAHYAIGLPQGQSFYEWLPSLLLLIYNHSFI